MTDYQKYINALRKCAKEHENDRTFTGHVIVSDLCRDTANLLEALEQEPFMNKPCISEGVCHDSAVHMLDNAISRTLAMETFAHWAEHKDYTHVERHILHAVVDELRAMPSISEQPDEWTPILKDLYDGMAEGGNS